MEILSILIFVCFVIILRMIWVTYDKIDLLENNHEEIIENQNSIKESINDIEMDLCEIHAMVSDIEDDIDELKK